MMLQPDYKSKSKKLTYQQAFNEILEFFNNDQDKALAWYMASNPLLGDVSPFQMIKLGRGQKLMKFIRSQLDENMA